MRKSIKTKMFIGICIFVLILTTFGVILNASFFKNYYLIKKKNNMINKAEVFREYYTNNSLDLEELLEKIALDISGNASLINLDKGVIYSTYLTKRNNQMLGMNVSSMSSKTINLILSEKIVFEIKEHKKFKTAFISLSYLISSKNILIIEVPLEAIEESAKISMEFSLITALFSLLSGSLIAYFYSKKFTDPIIELNEIAKDISLLKFSNKFKNDTGDEISLLGSSINEMSDRLKEAIFNLSKANKHLKDDIDLKDKIDEMRKTFISNVSHELKTPISLIQGYAEGLKEGVIEDSQNKLFYCDVIIEESEKMHKLVLDLLNLSELNEGSSKCKISSFDISALVDDVLNKFSKEIQEKKINIVLKKNDIIEVSSYKFGIEQVFINYLNNALNHLDNNLYIKIKIEEVETGQRLSVYNRGDLIPENELENIWMSFYKIDKARVRENSGSGLGLSIVKGILDNQKIKFGVNNLDNGVEFWFIL